MSNNGTTAMSNNGTTATAGQPAVIALHLQVRRDDPEVFEELQRRPEPDRTDYAQSALRIGVRAIQQASGSIDVERLKAVERQIIAGMEGPIKQYFDPKTGYLPTRLEQLVGENGQLDAKFKHLVEVDLAEQLATAFEEFVSELTLKDKDSAASQLIERLEGKQLKMVEGVREIIERLQKTEQERLAKEVTPKLDQIITQLAAKDASQAEKDHSTLHGLDFEDAVGEFVAKALAGYMGDGDNLEPVGDTKTKGGSKKGDFLWTLGPDSSAPEARIVIEAKASKSYKLKQAWEEIGEARENREADFGVFVFSKDCAPESLQPITRRGNDLMVVWGHEDRGSDLAFTVALSMARALVVRQQLESAKAQVDLSELDNAIDHVENAVSTFGDIRTWAGTISTNAGKIVKASEKAQADLEDQVKALNDHVVALKALA
jgi:hypothetical protein